MAVMLRLKKLGAKKLSVFRIVAIDSNSPRDGRTLDEIGFYDPKKENAVVTIDKEKAQKWLNNGAIPTLTVKNLLKHEGIEVKNYK